MFSEKSSEKSSNRDQRYTNSKYFYANDPYLRHDNLDSKKLLLKSTQYKTLVPNSLPFTYQNLKSSKPHKKQNKEHQNARFIVEKLKTKGLIFFVSFFSCDWQDFKF